MTHFWLRHRGPDGYGFVIRLSIEFTGEGFTNQDASRLEKPTLGFGARPAAI